MNPEFAFCLGSAGIGFAIIFVAVALSQIHDDLAKVLQRWAALDNLDLFNPDNDKEIDSADRRVLDKNQQWREGHEVSLDSEGDPRKNRT